MWISKSGVAECNVKHDMRSILSLLLALNSQMAFAVEPPVGWRLPTEKEVIGKPRAVIAGDFNGDGKQDHAYLFIKHGI